MLERVLHLSTSAGAALYDPGPSSVRSELEPRRTAAREPLLYDDFEQTERTEVEPSSRRDFEQTERHDFEPPSRRDFEQTERRDVEPPSRRDRYDAFPAAEVRAGDDERTSRRTRITPGARDERAPGERWHHGQARSGVRSFAPGRGRRVHAAERARQHSEAPSSRRRARGDR